MSIQGYYDPENIFKKIIDGEAPAIKVYEDKRVLAFMDIFPESQGHVLVVPKALARNLLDLDKDDLAYCMEKVQMISQAVLKALRPDGIKVMQYNGSVASQTVFHVHFHVVPCYRNISLKEHNTKQESNDVLEENAKKIKEFLF